MLGGIAIIVGIGLALILVSAMRRHAVTGERPDGTLVAAPESRQVAFGWLSLALGVVAIVSLAMGTGLTLENDVPFAFLLLSMTAGVAGLTLGLAGLRSGDRHWPVWAGLVAGGLPVVFWLVFALANLLSVP